MTASTSARYHTSCANCSSTDQKHLLENKDYISGETFNVVQCTDCQLVRTAYSIVNYSHYYPPVYYGRRGRRFFKNVEALISLSRRKRAVLVTALAPQGEMVLDVGCGRGIMLAELKKRGWNAFGIEAKPGVSKTAREEGCVIYMAGDGVYDTLRSEGPFDVVTLFHSLEHLPDPVAEIKNIHGVLKQSGLLILEVPNFRCLQVLLAQGRAFSVDAPRHTYHFSPDTLIDILQRSGFEVNTYSTHSLEYGYFGMVQSLLNMVTIENNVLYRLLRGEFGLLRTRRIFDVLISLLLPVILPLAIVLELLAAFFRRGAVVRLMARRV